MYCKTHKANMPVDGLYPSVGFWHQKLGMDEFLDGKDDAVFDFKPDRCAESEGNE
jgi:hypothetical protein